MSNFPFSCINWHFLKITVLTFFIISLVIFGLQRRTLSQIKALEILFWPCFIIFSPMINICWAIMSRLCIILWTFFLPTLYFKFLMCLRNNQSSKFEIYFSLKCKANYALFMKMAIFCMILVCKQKRVFFLLKLKNV